MRRRAYVGLGSNLGSREAFLRGATQCLAHHPAIELLASSKLYATPAHGGPYPDYLNSVVSLTTTLKPKALLAELLRIEDDFGRTRDVHWGPRTVDLDLLYYEGITIETPEITLPHPRIAERNFVLGPLLEIAPEFRVVFAATLEALGGCPPTVLPTASGRTSEQRFIQEARDDDEALAAALNTLLANPSIAPDTCVHLYAQNAATFANCARMLHSHIGLTTITVARRDRDAVEGYLLGATREKRPIPFEFSQISVRNACFTSCLL